MPKEYVKEQLWKLFEKLPKELQEIIFSEKTADAIGDICERNEVPEAKVPEVAKYTGRVLMGLLPPNEFEETLVKDVKLEREVAKSIAREITRFVFFPVKELLSQIYEMEITPATVAQKAVSKVSSEKPVSKIPAPERKEKTKKADTYRESFE